MNDVTVWSGQVSPYAMIGCQAVWLNHCQDRSALSLSLQDTSASGFQKISRLLRSHSGPILSERGLVCHDNIGHDTPISPAHMQLISCQVFRPDNCQDSSPFDHTKILLHMTFERYLGRSERSLVHCDGTDAVWSVNCKCTGAVLRAHRMSLSSLSESLSRSLSLTHSRSLSL